MLVGRKVLEGLLPLVVTNGEVRDGGDGDGERDGNGEVGRNKGGSKGSRDRDRDRDSGVGMERQEGIEDGFGKAVEALRRLKSQMPTTVARMERARVAGGYVAKGVTGGGGGAAGEGR